MVFYFGGSCVLIVLLFILILYMSEEHKMTKQDKLVLTITLAAIFFGVFGIGLFGLIFNLSS